MAGRDKKYVIDGSFALAYLLPDEHVAKVDAIFEEIAEGKAAFCSSNLILFEVGNALISAVKQRRIKIEMAKILLSKFIALEIEIPGLNYSSVVDLANKEKLTFYDSSYLWLARGLDLPLLTLDSHLAKYS